MSKASGQIARALRQAVRERKVSRYVVAKGSGIDHGALSRFLTGKSSLKLESVERLADYLGLELKPKGGTR